MSSPEEYRKRAKEARQQANTCRIELERQGLLIIAEQCERIAAYKDLIGRSLPATAPAQDDFGARQPVANDLAADGLIAQARRLTPL
jgi:hypothetical protein